MFNHLVDNFSDLSDSEVEDKIAELSRKYFQTQNPHLQQQVSVVLEMFKEEARSRRAKQKIIQDHENDDNSLDNLINIS
jgi:FKBP-type peptidyl-prolyl cis-trans isomerase (trigger factor)